jgi:hypothetical protein
MTPASEDIRLLVSRFRDVQFPHASEIMSLLEGTTAGATIELYTGATLQELRSTYRVRAEILTSRELPPTFPPTLPAEVRALAAALDAADEQPIRIWSLALPSGKVFVVFELVEAQRIAGAIASADQRVVAPPDERLAKALGLPSRRP